MKSLIRATAALALSFCAVATSFAQTPATERKVALVVGIDEYSIPEWRLRNSTPDARAVAEALRSKGFNVELALNTPRRDLERAFIDFASRAEGATDAVIFYSGQAFEFEGVPRLVASDAMLTSEKAARLGTVSLEDVMSGLAGASRLRLMIADICLDNPFRTEATPTTVPRLSASRPVMLLTSAAWGQCAVEGSGTQGTPFGLSLARLLSGAFLTEAGITQMLEPLRADVLRATNSTQKPDLLLVTNNVMSPQRPMVYSTQPRLALVIGNADYNRDTDYDDHRDSPPVRVEGFAPDLPNTLNDARDLRDALGRIRFTNIVYAENADKATMTAKLLEFRQKVREAGPSALVMVYYAGHAIQVNGANFLVPVGAKLPPLDLTRMSEPDVELALRDYAFPVNDLIASLRNPDGQGANIVILDACRNNPWELRTRTVGGGGATRGLADIPNSLQRTAIAFATKPGDTALDGEGQRNSPYMAVLKTWIERPGVSIRDLFDGVGNEVVRNTNNRQVPWLNAPPLGATCLGACAVQ